MHTVSFSDKAFLALVIPACDEPNILTCIHSLVNCDQPEVDVEVIVVVNDSVDSAESIRRNNAISIQQLKEFSVENRTSWLNLHIIDVRALPAKDAGVGLARRIGMDAAASAFERINSDGAIVCFDADCTCAPNYLRALSHAFQNSKLKVASIYFEHPLDGAVFDEINYEAIAYYETHLRYYVEALRYAGFPYAIHTVGSSMAVRASVYKKSGGMNKRKAGEDFYFLNKLVPNGGFMEVNDTVVFPSPRVSSRVPFGTGKAIQQYILDNDRFRYSYNLRSFEDLKCLFDRVEELFRDGFSSSYYDTLPKSVKGFVNKETFRRKELEIRKNSSNFLAYRKRFFIWWNAFMILKYVHHCRDNGYKATNVIDSIEQLFKKSYNENIIDCLVDIRRQQRKSPPFTVGLTL